MKRKHDLLWTAWRPLPSRSDVISKATAVLEADPTASGCTLLIPNKDGGGVEQIFLPRWPRTAA